MAEKEPKAGDRGVIRVVIAQVEKYPGQKGRVLVEFEGGWKQYVPEGAVEVEDRDESFPASDAGLALEAG